MRLFSDQYNLLLTTYQSATTKIGQSMAYEAIACAYREIAGALPWSYLHKRTQINTNPAYSTGTVSYNATTNVLTLTGGTWPSYASQSTLIINSNIYAIQTVLSSTTVSLVPGRAPVVNITGGTAFTMVQGEYVLPIDFLRTEYLVQVGSVWITKEVQPGSLLPTERIFYNPSRPWVFMIHGSSYYAGRQCLTFAPPPDIAYPFDLAYFAQPRQRTLAVAYSAGTVSANGTSVVGVGTAFTSSMAGCVLRQGTTVSAPVGEFGANGSTNETIIASVQDATHLTLLTPSVTTSGVGFVIDDYVDIDRVSMDELFCRLCESQFATLTRHNNRQQKKAEAMSALNVARARDVRVAPRPDPYSVPTLEAIAYANLNSQTYP